MVLIPAEELSAIIDEVVSNALQDVLLKQFDSPDLDHSNLPPLITRHQAAKILSVSLSTVDNYINDGLLQKKRVGVRAVRLDRTEVEKLARKV